jgi:hypothetical protein
MASLQYEVNRLAQDELVYESAVRGLTEVGTVEQMQKTLRNLLRMERGPNPLRLRPLAFTLRLKIAGTPFLGLLDSGASRTVMGGVGW